MKKISIFLKYVDIRTAKISIFLYIDIFSSGPGYVIFCQIIYDLKIIFSYFF